ncbi:hypothetical protein N9872_02335 [Paraglaciecola sp.]|nr:hypothetical protein [Paraglaciecola sp.]
MGLKFTMLSMSGIVSLAYQETFSVTISITIIASKIPLLFETSLRAQT